MAPFFNQITNLLATPEGNLLYYVVLSLSALGALLSCAYIRANLSLAVGKRMQGGLLVLFLAQLFMVVVAWLVWLGVVNSHTFLPPIDRTIALFCLVLIIWLWVVPEPSRLGDGITAGLELLILVGGAVSLVWWLPHANETAFNASFLGAYPYYLGIGLAIAGLVLLIWRKPDIWIYGSLMFTILLLGYLAQYILGQVGGDYPWFVRMGEMLAYPLLLALPKRLAHLSGMNRPIQFNKQSQANKMPLDADLVSSIVQLGSETSQQRIYQELTRVIAQLLDANICLLMMPPKVGEQIIVPVGYDESQAKEIEGFTLDGRVMPSLLEAIRTGKLLFVPSTNTKPEVQILVKELSLPYIPHMMFLPFQPKGDDTWLGIGLLSRQDGAIWSAADASYLRKMVDVLATNNRLAQQAPGQQANVEDLQVALLDAQAETQKIKQEYSSLSTKYAELNAQVGYTASQAESMIVLAASYKELQTAMIQLESRNRELEVLVTKGRPSIEEVDQLREELHSALVDLARMPSTLSKSDQRMLESQLSAMKKLEDLQQFELVTSIAEEFRQPMSAIIGYTDLLLGESVGLLGAMQRKFLERVKAATERMGMLLSELVEVVALDDGKLDQTPTSVDLAEVIDESVNSIIAQISEKNISMQVKLPQKLPAVNINRDALQQILANLLENACLVTPENGEIKLYAKADDKPGQVNFMHISVTDQGGGISQADIPRVFSRRYKVNNPLIQGIGDTGVGLSIVKSLVELDRGRIWVSTEEGVGSTFSILLPLAEAEAHPQPVEPS